MIMCDCAYKTDSACLFSTWLALVSTAQLSTLPTRFLRKKGLALAVWSANSAAYRALYTLSFLPLPSERPLYRHVPDFLSGHGQPRELVQHWFSRSARLVMIRWAGGHA